MSLVPLDPKWDSLIDREDIERLNNTQFLTRCREQRASHAELRYFVVQQHLYARHFTRYLCALLSNILIERDRLDLTENLLEEIGFGDEGGLPHAQIYRNMMAAMRIDARDEEPAPATQRLVAGMLEFCRDPNPMVGLGALCLGAEAIVPHVYSQIVEGFRGIGESDENLSFFLIHIEDDDAHAVTMKKIIDREIEKNPLQREVLRRTARAALQLRTEFFEALTEAFPQRIAHVPGGVYYGQLHI